MAVDVLKLLDFNGDDDVPSLDYVENWMALLDCITSKEYITVDKALAKRSIHKSFNRISDKNEPTIIKGKRRGKRRQQGGKDKTV